jgi:dCMP deaminase
MVTRTDPRPDWDSYFLEIAKTVATRADCTRRQVGTVIVDDQHRVVSVGYNGAAPGKPGCLTAGACPRGQISKDVIPSGTGGYDECIAIHSEANAIMYAGFQRTQGATLYCTDEPCVGCTKLIEGSGIARVVYSGSTIRSLLTSPAPH